MICKLEESARGFEDMCPGIDDGSCIDMGYTGEGIPDDYRDSGKFNLYCIEGGRGCPKND